jgi:hypothetical protein
LDGHDVTDTFASRRFKRCGSISAYGKKGGCSSLRYGSLVSCWPVIKDIAAFHAAYSCNVVIDCFVQDGLAAFSPPRSFSGLCFGSHRSKSVVPIQPTHGKVEGCGLSSERICKGLRALSHTLILRCDKLIALDRIG